MKPARNTSRIGDISDDKKGELRSAPDKAELSASCLPETECGRTRLAAGQDPAKRSQILERRAKRVPCAWGSMPPA